MDQVATWHAGRPRPRQYCVRWGCSSPSKGAQKPPTFRPMAIVAKRSPISATGELVNRYYSVFAVLNFLLKLPIELRDFSFQCVITRLFSSIHVRIKQLDREQLMRREILIKSTLKLSNLISDCDKIKFWFVKKTAWM